MWLSVSRSPGTVQSLLLICELKEEITPKLTDNSFEKKRVHTEIGVVVTKSPSHIQSTSYKTQDIHEIFILSFTCDVEFEIFRPVIVNVQISKISRI